MQMSGHCDTLQTSLLKTLTYHFFLRAEEGVTLQSLVVLALDNVSKHFVVHLVCSAIGYSINKGKKNTDTRWLEKKKTPTLDTAQIRWRLHPH